MRYDATEEFTADSKVECGQKKIWWQILMINSTINR